eukprot:TRINITY_DN22993_c0_g1_i1.p4 TRINITY_DN22993_c0_g1~~TRINITY_DN22993_c0_g1_i1.p4  ORF type:complete len:103 (-),score=7.89 TRINITY_DN22993_c0_g1_i1:1236-1544(-)
MGPMPAKPCIKCGETGRPAQISCGNCEAYICTECHWCPDHHHEIRYFNKYTSKAIVCVKLKFSNGKHTVRRTRTRKCRHSCHNRPDENVSMYTRQLLRGSVG